MNKTVTKRTTLQWVLAATAFAATAACTQSDQGAASPQGEAEGTESAERPAASARGERPSDALKLPPMPDAGPGIAQRLGDSYWYIPYATVNEEQMLAFIQAYRRYIEEGKQPPAELEVPEGAGAGGSDTLYRLRAGVTDLFIKNVQAPGLSAVSQSDIPVIITAPEPDGEGAEVLYMDGHVRFVPYGEFPVTENIIAGLKKLDPLQPDEQEG